jgi:hypothetical protein
MASDEPLIIALADLRQALARLLDSADARFGPSVDLDADHYWSINAGDAFALELEPSPQVGQLSDDVASVREFLSRDDGEVFIWHDLQHVIGVLQRLASLDLP